VNRSSAASRLLRVLPAVLYGSGIFYGGVIDLGKLPETPGVPTDKLLHALVFLGFEWWIELALLELRTASRRVAAVGLAALVGLGLELVQSALPHRSGELWDFVADAVGALLGAIVLGLLRWLVVRRPAPSESSA